MTANLFMLGSGDRLVPIEAAAYPDEEELERILAANPGLLAADPEAGLPGEHLLLARQLGLPQVIAGPDRWSADVVFADRAGVVTIIEVKLRRNPEIRRLVVAQLLEYAAAAVRVLSVDALRAQFERTWAEYGAGGAGGAPAPPDGRLLAGPERRLAEWLGPEGDPASWWQRVEEHLRARRLRLIVAADVLPTELKDILQFLNEQCRSVEIFGLEMPRQSAPGGTIIGCRITGQTIERRRGAPTPQTWPTTVEGWLDRLAGVVSPEAVGIARALLSWAETHHLPVSVGGGATRGSCIIRVAAGGALWPIVQLWSSGEMVIPLDFHRPAGVFARPEMVARLREHVAALGEPTLAAAARAEDRSRVTGWLVMLRDPTVRDGFLRILNWMVEQVRGAELSGVDRAGDAGEAASAPA
jgi:hypothetical protein